MALVTVLFSSFFVKREWFIVDRVTLTYTGPSSDARLLPYLQKQLKEEMQDFSKKTLWSVPMKSVKQKLDQEGWVKDFRIERRLPNQIRVTIEPKQTIGVYINKKGNLHPIVQDQVLKRDIPFALAPDVPIVRGDWDKASPELQNAMFEFLKQSFEAEKKWYSSENLKELLLDREAGLSVDLYEPQTRVVLGFDVTQLKLGRLQHVLEYVEQNSLEDRVIDSTFSKKVLVRLRKGP